MTASTITIKDPTARPTEKQEAFLAKLLKEKSHADAEIFRIRMVTGTLNRQQISDIIDVMLKSPSVHAAKATTCGAKIAPSAPADLPKPEHGYYQDADGTIWHFDLFKGKWAQQEKLYRLLVPGYGKPKWIYAGSSITAAKKLQGLAPITLEQAGKIGKLHGYCIRCNRVLSDPKSVMDGIGPVCKTYWGV